MSDILPLVTHEVYKGGRIFEIFLLSWMNELFKGIVTTNWEFVCKELNIDEDFLWIYD